MPCGESRICMMHRLPNTQILRTHTRCSFRESNPSFPMKVWSGCRGTLGSKTIRLATPVRPRAQPHRADAFLMLIPVFGSAPTLLSAEQETVRSLILGEQNRDVLEWLSL